MSNLETTVNNSPLNRGNTVAQDYRAQGFVNNVGSGLTATLTWNIFNRSFPDWVEKAKQFSTFLWAPRKVIGQGVKNIQWGTKETETYAEYKVGDLLQVKIKGRPKVYESRVGDLKIKIQVSLDYPPHLDVDKFIDAGEYVQYMNEYQAQLGQAMGKTMYEIFRWFFISSAFGTCLPYNEYDKLVLRTLAYPDSDFLPFQVQEQAQRFTPQVTQYSPLFGFMLNHRDTFKAIADEMNQKISNKYVFDAYDIIHNTTGTKFNPFNPWNPKGGDGHMSGMKRLANCLVGEPSYAQDTSRDTISPNGAERRLSREQSLKAMEIVICDIADRVEDPSTMWWQGNCGNITGMSYEKAWDSDNWPLPSERYPANKGTTIMDKSMKKRPPLTVECKKENKILVISKADYRDFINSGYEGGFGEQSMFKINWQRIRDKFSEVIVVDDQICGHFMIMDKRMVCAIPHLEATGRDTIMQRLATVDTMHKWLIFGLFDQYVGVRVQMVGFTGSPIDMNNIFINNKDIALVTQPR